MFRNGNASQKDEESKGTLSKAEKDIKREHFAKTFVKKKNTRKLKVSIDFRRFEEWTRSKEFLFLPHELRYKSKISTSGLKDNLH